MWVGCADTDIQVGDEGTAQVFVEITIMNQRFGLESRCLTPDSSLGVVRFFFTLMCLWFVWGCADGRGSLGEWLGGQPTQSPGQTARNAFNVHDADLRRESVASLSAAPFGGQTPYLRMYRLLIDDPDPTVRAACVKAIGMHGSMEDVKRLVARLEDQDTFVRWEAAKALQMFHDPAAVGPLVRVLGEDSDGDVRMATAYALGQYPQMRVYHALVGALDDEWFSVVQAACRSLHTLTGYDFGYEGSLWMMWARKQGDRLFERGQPYVWYPYQRPQGLLDRAMFWIERRPAQPRPPKRLELPGKNESDATS